MDPDAALAVLISAVEAGDFDAAQEALDTLRGWHEAGGFLPRGPRTEEA